MVHSSTCLHSGANLLHSMVQIGRILVKESLWHLSFSVLSNMQLLLLIKIKLSKLFLERKSSLKFGLDAQGCLLKN